MPKEDEHIDVATTESGQQPAFVSELKRLEELLANFPEIAPRVPVRLELPIKDSLDELCNREKVTIETLLEAFYVTCKDKESVMRLVIKEAKKRLKSRKEVGNIRSSVTKLNNLTKNRK
jgi:predicted DNA-binding ribbon-helix-helix protein